MIIGLSAGGLVLIIIIGVIAFCMCKKTNDKAKIGDIHGKPSEVTKVE